MHASLNVGYQGKSGPGKIHEVILVLVCRIGRNNRNDYISFGTQELIKIVFW